MTIPNEPPKPPLDPSALSSPNPEQVGELLSSPELAKAVESDDFKRFLDYVPIAIVISWRVNDQQRLVYANLAFESLTGQPAAEIEGKPWSILDIFSHENDSALMLGRAVACGEDFL